MIPKYLSLVVMTLEAGKENPYAECLHNVPKYEISFKISQQLYTNPFY